jgi:hypothetical protein
MPSPIDRSFALICCIRASCGIVLLSGHGCWSEQRDQDNKNEAESAVDHDE